MWLELFAWIESFAAVSFNPFDTLNVVSNDLAMSDPYGWKSNIEMSLDNVVELLNTLEEHRDEAPDSLGEISEVKANYTRQVIEEIVDKVNSLKTTLNLEITKIKGLDGLRKTTQLLANLIEYCSENNMEDAISSEKFNEFNDTNDHDITNVLGIYNQDMMNIYQCIGDIRDMQEFDDDEE